MTGSRLTLEERFWAKVDLTLSCWLWTGALTAAGYGQIGTGGRRDPKVYAHRYVYELLVGPIPEGLHIDHLCRVRKCVNPAHLEPVTQGENNRRALPGACRRAGHPYPENAQFKRDGKIAYCKVCDRERRRRYDLGR